MNKTTFRTLILAFFVAMISFNSNAQGLKIKSPYPDLKVKVISCEEAGSAVLVTLLLENIGSKDVEFSVCGGYDHYSVAIDDEGNQISNNNILVKIGNDHYNQIFSMGKLYSESPVKITYKISDVPEHAKSFSKLNLYFNSNDWGVYGEHIKISNISIYREGDE